MVWACGCLSYWLTVLHSKASRMEDQGSKFMPIGDTGGKTVAFVSPPHLEMCLYLHVIFLGFIFPVLGAEPRDLGLLDKHYTTELNLQC